MNQLTSGQQAVLFSVLLEAERIAAANVQVAILSVPQLEDHYRKLLSSTQQALRDGFDWSPRFTDDGREIANPQYRLQRRPCLVERAMQ